MKCLNSYEPVRIVMGISQMLRLRVLIDVSFFFLHPFNSAEIPREILPRNYSSNNSCGPNSLLY